MDWEIKMPLLVEVHILTTICQVNVTRMSYVNIILF